MNDARGYSCPTPLLMIQKAIKEGKHPATVEMLVDAPCAVENVSRYGRRPGTRWPSRTRATTPS